MRAVDEPDAARKVGQPNLPLPLWLRLLAAAALVAWGALTDRRWTVPAAAVLALPVMWFSGLAILAAIPALGRVSPPSAAYRQSS